MTYEERIPVPWLWWLFGAGVVASVALATFVYVEAWQSITLVILAAVLIVVALLSYTMRIRVADGVLTVGRHQLEGEYVAEAVPVEHDGGASVDRDAFFLTRPWVKGLVRVVLDDPADPHPSWLVSSRRPDELAAAVNAMQES